MAHYLNVEDLQGLRYAAVHIYKCEENIVKKFKTHIVWDFMYITTATTINKSIMYVFSFREDMQILTEWTGTSAEHHTRTNIFSLHKCVYLQRWCVKWGLQGTINDNLCKNRT